MAFKKIGKKAAGATILNLIICTLIVMAIFTGMFLWMNFNITSSGATMDTKYNDSYNRMITQQNRLDQNVKDIQTGINSVTEADKSYFAMNGLKGMLAVLKTPILIADVGKETSSALTSGIDVIPNWVMVLYYIGLTALVVIIIVAAMKGEPGSMK